MLILGKYETVEQLRRSSSEEIWSARQVGAAGRSYVAHLFQPPVTHLSQSDRQAAVRSYLQRVQVEKQVTDVLGAGKVQHWPRVYDWGETGDGGAAYISDCPRFSLDRLLKLKRELSMLEIWHIVCGIADGLGELQQACRGRNHGNLHAETVLLGDLRDPTRSPIVLIDPLPPERLAVYNHPHVDTRSLGAILYELVEQRRYDSAKPWAVQTTNAWARCGKKEAEWRRLCERLIDPSMPAPSVREIVADLHALSPRAPKVNKRIAIISAVAGLAAAVAVALVIGSFGGAGTPPAAAPSQGTAATTQATQANPTSGSSSSSVASGNPGASVPSVDGPPPTTTHQTPPATTHVTPPATVAWPPLVPDGSRQLPADLPPPLVPPVSAAAPKPVGGPVAMAPVPVPAAPDAFLPPAPIPGAPGDAHSRVSAELIPVSPAPIDPIAPAAPGQIAIDLPAAAEPLKPVTPLGPVAFKPRRITNALKMEMIEIPAGTFAMGSPAGEAGRDAAYEKQRDVQVAGCFFAAHEVTRGQFAAFVQATNHVTTAESPQGNFRPGAAGFQIVAGRVANKGRIDGLQWRSPGFDQEDDHPVVCVSWKDATAFCDWLSRKEGRVYRLPTEREWEYACRAGAATAYHWGQREGDAKDHCNGLDRASTFTLDKKFGAFSAADNWRFTAAVTGRKANAWGLFDMHGNAAEWCHDWEATAGVQLPQRGRAVRGGSFYDDARACRSAARFFLDHDQAASFIGFRVVTEKKAGE